METNGLLNGEEFGKLLYQLALKARDSVVDYTNLSPEEIRYIEHGW